MEKVVSNYLKSLGIPISNNYFEELIASHPDYPSLLSIADTLERLGVDHTIVQVEKKDWNRLPLHCLYYYDEDNKQARELKLAKDPEDLPDNAQEDASLVILKAEPTEEISDKENRKERAKEKLRRYLTVVSLAAIAGLMLLVSLPFETWIHPTLLITAAVGTFIGYLLVAKDVGITYDPVETFCTSGEKTDCNAVLRSDAATLWGDITLSDLTISYFLFQLVTAGFLLPFDTTASTVLSGLSMLGIPVVLYSLYWQYKENTWCRICLLVGGVLVLQAALFAYMYSSRVGSIGMDNIRMSSVAQLGLLFLGIGSSLLLIKQTLNEANWSKQAKVKANRIKNDPEIFMQLLTRQKGVDTAPFDLEMRIGTAEAPIQILMAASLGCGPCKEGFEKAIQLVSSYPGKVQLAVRLRVKAGDNGIPTPGTWLLGYWQQNIVGQAGASRHTEHLLRDWYDTMDLEKFKQEYGLQADDIQEKISVLQEAHASWIEQAEIKGTPTFFVNGYQLPGQYNIEDLQGMIPALAAGLEEKQKAGNGQISVAKTKS